MLLFSVSVACASGKLSSSDFSYWYVIFVCQIRHNNHLPISINPIYIAPIARVVNSHLITPLVSTASLVRNATISFVCAQATGTSFNFFFCRPVCTTGPHFRLPRMPFRILFGNQDVDILLRVLRGLFRLFICFGELFTMLRWLFAKCNFSIEMFTLFCRFLFCIKGIIYLHCLRLRLIHWEYLVHSLRKM